MSFRNILERQRVKSRFNLAVSYHVQSAVVYSKVESNIAYDKIVYAKGNLLGPQNLVCEAAADTKLLFKRTDNSAQG